VARDRAVITFADMEDVATKQAAVVAVVNDWIKA
jgi:hypothetical protein